MLDPRSWSPSSLRSSAGLVAFTEQVAHAGLVVSPGLIATAGLVVHAGLVAVVLLLKGWADRLDHFLALPAEEFTSWVGLWPDPACPHTLL